jgi:TolB-like protein
MVVREIDHQRLADVEAKARAKALRMQPATVEQLRQKYADYRARGAARTQEEKIRVIREVADANPHMAIRTIARVLRHEWYTVAAVLPERRKNAANSDLIR